MYSMLKMFYKWQVYIIYSGLYNHVICAYDNSCRTGMLLKPVPNKKKKTWKTTNIPNPRDFCFTCKLCKCQKYFRVENNA